jgi:hypothetical protein
MTGDVKGTIHRHKAPLSTVAILVVSIIAIIGVCFYSRSVPIRQFNNQAWLQTESLSDIPTDAKIDRMMRTAISDHYVAPTKGMPRKLIFLRAMAVAPNDVYLIFWPDGVADTTVRYRGDRDSERLYWKTIVSE